jgi:5-(carboxyamino)imidazole ribonucleotide synthase
MIRTIGIIGGGQLGRMLTLDAKRMGFSVIVLDPQVYCPGGQVADDQIVAPYNDLAAVDELGKRCDVVTFEFENIDLASILHLEAQNRQVFPSSSVLKITQDRLLEKRFLRENGIATVDFDEINRVDDLSAVAMTIGFPAVLKTSRGGYDGKGQWRANALSDARAAFSAARGATMIFERHVNYTRELSVIATRDAEDNVVTYPTVENLHDNGILSTTIAPGRIQDEISKRARSIAKKVGQKLQIVGTYCVEFFLTNDDELLVNEIAPRPHNSGHFSMDVTQCSQYEQHIRAICGLPLAIPRMFSYAIMMNILGDGLGDVLVGIPKLLEDRLIVLHLYGKREATPRRKMGHFTMLVEGPIDDQALKRARVAHGKLSWMPAPKPIEQGPALEGEIVAPGEAEAEPAV